MKTLTVVTPTYNRADLLKNAYRSLAAQTCRDFVWMIVDDGSTDDTESAVESFAKEGSVEIVYLKKENGGKHTALNLAISELKTELVAFCLDSDDEYLDDAVEKIVSLYHKTEKKYDGYVFPRLEKVSKIDDSLEVMSWQEAVSGEHFEGESIIVLKSGYAKRFSFPVFEGEHFCTEGNVWLRMTAPFYWSRDNICRGDYHEDGYSRNILKLFASAPRSYMLYNDLRLSLCKGFIKKMKYAAYYDGFSLFAKERGFIGKSSAKLFSALALPLGIVFYLVLKIKK